jgi:hypothetical protein
VNRLTNREYARVSARKDAAAREGYLDGTDGLSSIGDKLPSRRTRAPREPREHENPVGFAPSFDSFRLDRRDVAPQRQRVG